MTPEELIELLRSYEWRDVEFKEARSAVPRSAYETVSAFANTEGGHLVFGVRESGNEVEIVGVLEVDKAQGDLLSTLRQRDKISTLVPVREHLRRHEDADLLIFHVPEAHRSEKPVFLDGDIRRAFVRSGGNDVRLSNVERDRFLMDAAAERYDSQPIDLDPGRAFDEESLGWYRSIYESRPGNRSYRTLSDYDFLGEMGLLRDEGGVSRPSRAAVLLFGSDRAFRQLLPRAVVDCQRFGLPPEEASTGERWFDRLVLEDNLLRTWRSLMDTWYPRFTEHPFRVDPGTLRRDDAPLDLLAIREALVNLLMHQDYADHGRCAEILHYPDQTVFRNPGDAFAPTADLLEPGEKDTRNPQIVRAFRRIGLSENAGWGLRDVFRTWRQLGRVPPRITNSKRRKRFELTLGMETITERQQAFERRFGVRLEDAEARILDFTWRAGAVSVSQLRVVTGLTHKEVGAAAGRLVTQALLQRAGSGRFRVASHLPETGGGLGQRATDQVVGRRADLVSDQVTKSALESKETAPQPEGSDLTAAQGRIVDACEAPRSLAEVLKLAGATHRTFFRRTHLQPLIDAGIVRMTNPGNPRAANQRYVLTEAGAAIRARRLRHERAAGP